MGDCSSRERDPHEPPTWGKIHAFLGDNSIQIDADKSEQQIRAECPKLMLANEKVVMGFRDRGGIGRDDFCFTNLRVLIRDVRGMSGNSVCYQSIPYGSIESYSIESAGSSLDGDSSLRIHSVGMEMVKMDFVANSTEEATVDIYAIGQFFDKMVLVDGKTGASGAETVTHKKVNMQDPGKMQNFFDMVGSNYRQVQTGPVEEMLRPNILMSHEKLELAFQCGRDLLALTSLRILKMDVQGVTGKRAEYWTLLWNSLRAFELNTPASWFLDGDAEMILYTCMSDMPRIPVDFKKNHADLMRIQKFITNKLLGMSSVEASKEADTATINPEESTIMNFLGRLGNDCRMINAEEVDKQFHSDPPILQKSEKVEMAFQGGLKTDMLEIFTGRRDLIIFTSKRLLIVDKKGMRGIGTDCTNYFSIPWTTVQAFAVRSSELWLDKDSEMMIWTDINDVYYPPPPPKQHDDDKDPPPPPPIPRNSFIEIDFQADKVDILAVHRYLSERCLRVQAAGFMPPEATVSPDVWRDTPSGWLSNFLHWIGGDMKAIDPKQCEEQMKGVLLQKDEHVVMAFNLYKDVLALTTKRVLLQDTQGWSAFLFQRGKVLYKSVPYTSLRSFSVCSAGAWDMDAEMDLYCKTYWTGSGGSPGSVMHQDLRKGNCDVIAIQSMLAAQIIGRDDGSMMDVPTVVGPKDGPGGIEGFLSWISGDAHEIAPAEAEQTMHETPPILLQDEHVELCFKIGNDFVIFTTKRAIYVNVAWPCCGGNKWVSHMTYPLKYFHGFQVKSAGMIEWLDSAGTTVSTDSPGSRQFHQDLNQSHTDIWSVQSYLSQHILLRRQQQ